MGLVAKDLSNLIVVWYNLPLLLLMVVLLAIFVFGGESIRGFMFALIVGIVVGTYSSLFIASPLMFDTVKRLEKKNKKEEN